MSSSASVVQKQIPVDQDVTNQTVPEGIGTFKSYKETPSKRNTFTFKQPQESFLKIGTSEIRTPSNVGYELLKNLDVSRLASILAQEAVKIGNLEDPKTSDIYRLKLLRALSSLNPKKYPPIKDEVSDEVTIKKETQNVTDEPTSLPLTPKKMVPSPPMFLKTFEDRAPKPKIIRSSLASKPKLKEVIGTPAITIEEKTEPVVDLYETLRAKKIETPPQKEEATQEKERIIAVRKVLEVFNGRFTTGEEWGGPTAFSVVSPKKNNSFEGPSKNIESWRDGLSDDLKIFLNDIITP